MEAKSEEVPQCIPAPVYPSIVNNVPLPGWHQQVDWSRSRVVYWAPLDQLAGEVPRLLTSDVEIQEWLAQCNAAHLADRFHWEIEKCLERLPGSDLVVLRANGGSIPNTGADTYENLRRDATSAEIFIERALGRPINKYFEYFDATSFAFTYASWLKTQRASVAIDIERQCQAECLRRQRIQASWKKEKMACLPHAASALAWDRSQKTENDLSTLDYEFRASSLTPLGVSLLHHTASTLTASELLRRGPHLCTPQSHVYLLPSLFTPEYCSLLISAAQRFRAAAGPLASIRTEDTRSRPNAVSLDKMGLSRAISDRLLELLIRPLAARLFKEYGGALLDVHFGFIQLDEAVSADISNDDAEVCLDVFLGPNQTNYPISNFYGAYHAPIFPPSVISHRGIGSALFTHRTLRSGPETAGCHLILLCRSSAFRTLMNEGLGLSELHERKPDRSIPSGLKRRVRDPSAEEEVSTAIVSTSNHPSRFVPAACDERLQMRSSFVHDNIISAGYITIKV